MAFGLDDALEGTTGVVVGLGLGLVATTAMRGVGKVTRPMAKMAIGGYLSLSEAVRHSTAEYREQWADLVAEVKAEREAADSEETAPTTESPSSGV